MCKRIRKENVQEREVAVVVMKMAQVEKDSKVSTVVVVGWKNRAGSSLKITKVISVEKCNGLF